MHLPGPADPAPIITLREVTKRYGSVVALNRVTLEVGAGEIVGLLGPNGAGKTTMLELIEGLQEPSCGDVLICGRRHAQLSAVQRGRIGLVFQRNALPTHLRVRELVAMYEILYPEESPAELAQSLGIAHLLQRRIGELSAGQQQRLSLWCALYGPKDAVLLDEPTSALDVRSRQAVQQTLLARRQRQHFGVLLATHDMSEAMLLCDRVYFIDAGDIRLSGRPRELLELCESSAIVEFSGSPALVAGVAAYIEKQSSCELLADGSGWKVRCPHEIAPHLLATIYQQERVCSCHANARVHEGRLEDLYLQAVPHVD